MKQDTGYARFVRLVKQHPNPHFPKISDIRRLIFDDQVYYIYLIEKLQRDTTPRGKNIAEGCRKVVDFHNTPLEQLFPDYDGVLAYLKRRPKLVEALRLIGESSNNYSIDLGSANFMYRPDHTLVITDPYAD